MRRIQLVLAALVVVVAAFAAFAGPAIAKDHHLKCRDAWGYFIKCDGKLYAPYHRYDHYPSYYYYPSYYHYPYCYWEYSWVFEEWQWECD